MRIFRYIPLFCLVFLVAMAMSLQISKLIDVRTSPNCIFMFLSFSLQDKKFNMFMITLNVPLDGVLKLRPLEHHFLYSSVSLQFAQGAALHLKR